MTDNKSAGTGKGEEDELKEFEEAFDFETEEEHPAATTAGATKSGTVSPAQIAAKPSKLPLIIGGIVVAFLGWKGYHFLFSTPSTSLENEKPPKEEMAAATKKIQPPISATAPQVISTEAMHTAPVTPPAPVPDAVTHQITQLENNQKQMIDKINQLDSHINQLAQAMGANNQHASQATEMTKEISTLSSTVQNLNKEIKTLKNKLRAESDYNHGNAGPFRENYESEVGPRPAKTKKHGTLTRNPSPTSGQQETESFASPSVVVHAIIPGRAWLKTKDGSTITVTEGDNLEHYGKILVIDAPNGVVITSSGATLR